MKKISKEEYEKKVEEIDKKFEELRLTVGITNSEFKSSEKINKGIMHYAQGAVKAVQAMTLPETEESKARLAVCHGCDKWTGKSCKVCGCYVNLKVKIPEEKCPEGKW